MNAQVGTKIDFYNVQFYNQGNTAYTTYTTLFTNSSGYFNKTSVKQINARGIPLKKIIVGKPATSADLWGTGYVSSTSLGNWTKKAYTDFKWYGGVMYWQFQSDLNGTLIKNAAGNLKALCASSGICV